MTAQDSKEAIFVVINAIDVDILINNVYKRKRIIVKLTILII